MRCGRNSICDERTPNAREHGCRIALKCICENCECEHKQSSRKVLCHSSFGFFVFGPVEICVFVQTAWLHARRSHTTINYIFRPEIKYEAADIELFQELLLVASILLRCNKIELRIEFRTIGTIIAFINSGGRSHSQIIYLSCTKSHLPARRPRALGRAAERRAGERHGTQIMRLSHARGRGDNFPHQTTECSTHAINNDKAPIAQFINVNWKNIYNK